jgi:hypothetical protein
MKFELEEWVDNYGEKTYIIWFNHEIEGILRVKTHEFYSYEKALEQMEYQAKKMHFPKITLLKEIKL